MSKIYKENYHRESKYGLKETNSIFLLAKICTCITISEAQHE